MSPMRPWCGGIVRSPRPPNVTTPSRFPRRVDRWPIATATPSATSAFLLSPVPNSIETEVSRTSHVTSTRSARSTRTCGSPVRAVTFQSIRRTSSPGAYGRIIASSEPVPRRLERKSPASSPSTLLPIETSRARSSPSAIGPGPGRSGVGRARSVPAFVIRVSRSAHPGEVELWDGHRLQHLLENRVGADLFCERLVREDEPVPQRVACKRL